jgi:hypothetical protein
MTRTVVERIELADEVDALLIPPPRMAMRPPTPGNRRMLARDYSTVVSPAELLARGWSMSMIEQLGDGAGVTMALVWSIESPRATHMDHFRRIHDFHPGVKH